MSIEKRRTPGFIYSRNQQNVFNSAYFTKDNSLSDAFVIKHHQESCDSISDLNEYFQSIQDPQEQDSLPQKMSRFDLKRKERRSKARQDCKGLSVQVQHQSNKLELNNCYESEILSKPYNQSNEKSISQTNPNFASQFQSNKQFQKQEIPKQTTINPQEHKDSVDTKDDEIQSQLPQQKKLQQPYFQFTFVEQPQKVIVVEEKKQSLSNSSIIIQENRSELQQKQQRQKQQRKLKHLVLLFQEGRTLDELSLMEQKSNLQVICQIFSQYKLQTYTPLQISPSIPTFIKELVLLKNLQNSINFNFKLMQKSSRKNQSFTSSILKDVQKFTDNFLLTSSYTGLDKIFTTYSKIQQIKRFLVFERLCAVIFVYLVALGKFIDYKSFLSNLIGFSIQNHIAVLSHLMSSKYLSRLIQKFYPQLTKKGLELVKVNNDSINEIIAKLSTLDQTFFSSLNKLAKRCISFPYNQLTKEFLQFLAFYIHRNSLEAQVIHFSTPSSPFLNILPEKYYLVIDATQFYLKDKKGTYFFRPFYQNFLQEMTQHYVIVNYSNLSPKQSKQLIEIFDKKKHIKHQLFSHHFQAVPHAKRLIQKVSSSKQKLIYLNCEQNQACESSVNLKKWKGDKKDRELIDIFPILISISHLKLNCQEVASALDGCGTNISKMQQSLLSFFKKVKITV